MKFQVRSFSGGRTSAYMCALLGSDENSEDVFMDTGAEHEETYRFIKNFCDVFGRNVTFLRGDFSLPIGSGVGFRVVSADDLKPDYKPYAEMLEKYGTPYIGGAFCTDRMKEKPFKKYCEDRYGKGNYETWLGIRFDEPRRLWGDHPKRRLSVYRQLVELGMTDLEMSDMFVELKSNREALNELVSHYGIKEDTSRLIGSRLDWIRKNNLNYLAEISDFDKQDIINWWSKQDFDLGAEEHEGNCVLCIKKSENKVALAARDNPNHVEKMAGIINSTKTRVVESRSGTDKIMYRGNNTLESLIAKFSMYDRDEIAQRVRGAKLSGGCTESCEAFGCSSQLDLFL